MFKTIGAVITLTALTTLPVLSNSNGLANSVSNIDTVRLVQNHWYGSTDKELNINSVRVGDTVNGLKINYIGCLWQTSTVRGWRGGPDYISKSGTYNCFAGAKRNQIGPGKSGPQLIMSVVKSVR